MPHAPNPLPHLLAPAALHRRTHAHEPRLPAPAQDVAGGILGEDVTQIEVYTERVKGMVGKVLTFNGITRYAQGAYDLVGGEELSDAERDEMLQLCRQRLDTFRMQRGEKMGCLLKQKPAASGTGAATARRSAARSKSGHGADGLAMHQPQWNAVVDAGRRSRNQIRWAGTVRWSAARPQEPAWPASNHGWPASSARSLH